MPDYSVTTLAGLRIGIELTEIFHSASSKEQSSIQYKLTNKLLAKLTQVLPYKFTLSLKLDPLRHLSMAKEVEIVAELVEICIEEFCFLQNGERGAVQHIDFDLSQITDFQKIKVIKDRGYRNLPSGISEIRIYRYDNLPYSYNTQNEGGIVPNLTHQMIQSVLDKKEEKIAAQNGFTEHWLIIREGNYFTGSFDRVDVPIPVLSLFDKLFVFRTSMNDVIELK